MNSKERMLTALHKGKPDRLPVSVHQWQQYHLDTYLGGITALEAFERFGMDAQIQYFQTWASSGWSTPTSRSSPRRNGRTRSRSSATTRTTASPITRSARPRAR